MTRYAEYRFNWIIKQHKLVAAVTALCPPDQQTPEALLAFLTDIPDIDFHYDHEGSRSICKCCGTIELSGRASTSHGGYFVDHLKKIAPFLEDCVTVICDEQISGILLVIIKNYTIVYETNEHFDHLSIDSSGKYAILSLETPGNLSKPVKVSKEFFPQIVDYVNDMPEAWNVKPCPVVSVTDSVDKLNEIIALKKGWVPQRPINVITELPDHYLINGLRHSREHLYEISEDGEYYLSDEYIQCIILVKNHIVTRLHIMGSVDRVKKSSDEYFLPLEKDE